MNKIQASIYAIPAGKCGVYCIFHIPSGRQYIGSSKNMRRRLNGHKSHLLRGAHHSEYLQKTWNAHGADEFDCMVLEEVECINDLIDREQFWIDKLCPVFNMCKTAVSKYGIGFTPLTREKLSQIATERQSTPEARAKMAESIREWWSLPETKEMMAVAAKKSWTPERLKKHRELMRTPERKASMSKKKGPISEEQKIKIRETNLKSWSSPELKEKHSKALRAIWEKRRAEGKAAPLPKTKVQKRKEKVARLLQMEPCPVCNQKDRVMKRGCRYGKRRFSCSRCHKEFAAPMPDQLSFRFD